MSRISYQVEQFNTEHAPEEIVQYVLNNVDDFGHRYTEALKRIGTSRGTLHWVDPELYLNISDAIYDWCEDNGDDPDKYDIEEIFG